MGLKFIGREEELNTLKQMYSDSSFQFGIVYGRRRIGKSTLLKEFIKDKRATYLVATEKRAELNLEEFAKVISENLNTRNIAFKTFGEMFDFLFTQIKEKHIVIIDEFTYLIDIQPSIMSELQNSIDKYKHSSQLKIIISGSHVGMIEDMLSYKKPLYARKTFEIKLKEYDYYESSLFYPNFSAEDKVRAYAVFSGVAHYLSLVDDRLSLKENIINLFLKNNSNLNNEVDFLLQTEFRSKANYSSAIQAISLGKTRLNEISQVSHINDTAKTSTYLKPLIEMEIVQKEFSFEEENNVRKTIYRIKNNLVNFIYRFIEKNKSAKELLSPEDFYNTFIADNLDEYTSLVFENVCKQFLMRINKTDKVKDKIIKLGRYWLNDSKSKTQIEIDICAKTLSGYSVYECKWQNSKVDNKVMTDLQNSCSQIKAFITTEVGAFSKSGFSEGLTKKFSRLYDLESLFSV